jgi:hypothetical protein
MGSFREEMGEFGMAIGLNGFPEVFLEGEFGRRFARFMAYGILDIWRKVGDLGWKRRILEFWCLNRLEVKR